MADKRNGNMAIPLCLPNNCQWNTATGEYIKTGERRSSLYVVDEAVQKLQTVRGELYNLVFIAMFMESGRSLDFGSSSPGTNHGRGHYDVFLVKTIYSHSGYSPSRCINGYRRDLSWR